MANATKLVTYLLAGVISRLQRSAKVNGATGARKPAARASFSELSGRESSRSMTAEIRGAHSMVDNPASRYELVRAATTAALTVRSSVGPGGLGRTTDVLTSWTSWTSCTTSDNASQGRRRTLLVDVDYGRKTTSHKSPLRSRGRPARRLPRRPVGVARRRQARRLRRRGGRWAECGAAVRPRPPGREWLRPARLARI